MREEELLEAWVGLTSILKNSRLTNELSYNESIIMMLLYKQYQEDHVGQISLKEILEHTKMLKSLANRTINELEKKNMLIKRKAEQDSRRIDIRPTELGINEFLSVHKNSLMLAIDVINIIGIQDAEAIIRAYQKLQIAEKEQNHIKDYTTKKRMEIKK